MQEYTMKYKWTIRLSFLTPFLLIIVVFLSGGGHGFYEPAVAFFPLGMLACLWFNKLSLINVILAVLQFPLYGFLIDRFTFKRISYLLLIVHVLLVFTILKFRTEVWN
ncbi:hypothetical protein [Flavobacterium sp.]|uniref:hypothetical protein n=1 Tax=Flavobacterium sp. TaxID=239 RepID=UPI003B99B1E0